MATPIISIRNASVVYGAHSGTPQKAIDDISLDIYSREYVIFFGPSGCGKSTLLYSIAGLEQLTTGQIVSNGYDLTALSVADAIQYHRSSIGMVFQAYYLISTLTNMQNVTLPQVFSSSSRQVREAQALKFLERFGIDQQAYKFPNQLSGGQQQRVSIARALINEAPILLADEPVGNLDSKAADSVLEVFTELNKKDGKTIIMVTHNPNHLKFADRVFYMKDGKIIREVRNSEEEVEKKKEQEIQPFINHGLQEFAKIYPHLEEEELKSKMVTWYLLNELDIQAEQRLEQIVGDYLKKKISLDDFVKIATAPIRKSGIGLYHPFAKHMAERLDHIAKMSEYMIAKFRTYPSSYDEYQIILDNVTAYLLEITEHKATGDLLARLQSIVKSRLEGSLGHDGFMALLDKPFAQGGAGLNVRTARNIARQLELILMNFDEMKRGIGDKRLRPHLFGIKNAGTIQQVVASETNAPAGQKPEGANSENRAQSRAEAGTTNTKITPPTMLPNASVAPKNPLASHVDRAQVAQDAKTSAHDQKQALIPLSPSHQMGATQEAITHTPAIDRKASRADASKLAQVTGAPSPLEQTGNKRLHTTTRKSEVHVPRTSHAASRSDLGALERMTVEQLERMTEEAQRQHNTSFILPDTITSGPITSRAPSVNSTTSATKHPSPIAQSLTKPIVVSAPSAAPVIMPKTSSGDVKSYVRPVQHPQRAQSVLPPKPPPRMYVPIDALTVPDRSSERSISRMPQQSYAEHFEYSDPDVVFPMKVQSASQERKHAGKRS